MGEVITIGLDIAKSVFQVHGVDDAGTVVIRKRVSRSKMLEFFADLPPCLVGIEACPAAHHWGRELQALGHTVKLMPPSYVKAYLKRSKNDANDAAALCEAVSRPSLLGAEPAAGRDSGRRADCRHCSCCRDRRLEGVQVGAWFGCLDRAGAEATHDWRQGQARQHHQAGQSILAMASRRRRHGRDPLRAKTRDEEAAVVRAL